MGANSGTRRNSRKNCNADYSRRYGELRWWVESWLCTGEEPRPRPLRLALSLRRLLLARLLGALPGGVESTPASIAIVRESTLLMFELAGC